MFNVKKHLIKKILLKIVFYCLVFSPILVSTLSCSSTHKKEQDSSSKSSMPRTITSISDVKKLYKGNYVISNPKFIGDNRTNFLKNIESEIKGGQEKFFRRPVIKHWQIKDLINWNPNNKNSLDSVFDNFAISTMPLQKTDYGMKASKHTKQSKEHNLSIALTYSTSTSQTPMNTVPKNNDKNQIFTMWDYVQHTTQWGGSLSEGQILIPKSEDIQASHLNGKKILGNLFLYEGWSRKFYEDLLKKDKEGRFIVANALINIANYYGFDGWFLDFETTDGLDEYFNQLQDFLKYFYQHKGDNLLINLYQWNAGNRLFDSQYFDWYSVDHQARDKYDPNIKNSRTHNLSLAKKNKLTFGYEFEKFGFNEKKDSNFNFEKYKNSWIYRYFKYANTNSPNEEQDMRFFSGYKNEDGFNPHPNDWFLETTTILDKNKPFSSAFALGLGKSFFVNGKEQELSNYLGQNGYKNIGLQDMLPTYRYLNYFCKKNGSIVEDFHNENIIQSIKNADSTNKAYFGSNFLNYNYELKDEEQKLATKLFATKISLEEGQKFKFIYRKTNANSLEPSLALWGDPNDPEKFIKLAPSQKKILENNFIELEFDITKQVLEKTKGKNNLFAFGTVFDKSASSNSDKKSVQVNLNFVQYIPKNLQNSSKLQIEKVNSIFTNLSEGNRVAAIDFNFKNLNPGKVKMNVFYTSKNKNSFEKGRMLGISHNNSAYLVGLPLQKNVPIIVDTYDFNHKLIGTSNFVLRTTFSEMNNPNLFNVDKVNFNKDENQKLSIYVGAGFIQKGYLKNVINNEDEEFFVIDNYSEIHKINKFGEIISKNNSKYFGRPIIQKDSKDIKRAKLIDFDKNSFLAFILTKTNDTKFVLIDKKTGKSLDSNLQLKGNFKKVYLIRRSVDSLMFVVEKTDGSLGSMVIKLKDNKFINKNWSIKELQGEQIKRVIFFNENDNLILAIDKSDKFTSFKITEKDLNTLELQKTSSSNIGTNYDEMTNYFKDNYQDWMKEVFEGKEFLSFKKQLFHYFKFKFPIKSSDQIFDSIFIDKNSLGKILFFKKVKDKFVLINKKGIVIVFDQNMQIKKGSFLLPKDYFKKMLVEYKNFGFSFKEHPGVFYWLEGSYSGIFSPVFDGLTTFRDNNNQISLLKNEDLQFHWWGNWSFNTKGEILNLKLLNLIDPKSKTIFVQKSNLLINFENPNKKFGYDFQIVLNPTKSSNYLVFDNYGYLRVFNKQTLQEKYVPQLVLKYEKEIIQRKECLYDLNKDTKWFIKEFQDKMKEQSNP